MEIHFDKTRLKLLNYIQKHPGVSEISIAKKFTPDALYVVRALVKEGYLLAPTLEDAKSFPHLTPNENAHIYTGAQANILLETRKWDFAKWFVPLIVSFISLGISVAGFIINFQKS